MSSSLKLSNNGIGRLAGNLLAGSTSFSLTPGDGLNFPVLTTGQWFPATIVRADGVLEIVRVTARATDVFTVTRAQEGTAAAAFSAGDRVEHRFTAGAFTDEIARVEAIADAAVPKAGGTMTGDLTMGAGTKIVMEGTTDDAFEVTLDPGNPTADRTITLPDKSGTLPVAADVLALTGGTMTGALTMNQAVNESRATVPSHATTGAIWAAAGNSIDWTGTATAATFAAAPQAGAKRRLHCAGACSFTHSATLDIVGNASFTAAAGDIVDVEAITTTTFRLIPIREDGQSIAGGVAGTASRLKLVNNTATPNSKVDVTADEMILKNASGKPLLVSNVNLTLDIAVAGLNGLDTGAEAVSTWYSVWVLSDGTAIGGVLSLSATAPTLPGAYTYKGFAGWVRNDSSGNFLVFVQFDWKWACREVSVFSGMSGVLSYTAQSISGQVPPQARYAIGRMGDTSTGGRQMSVAGDLSGIGMCEITHASGLPVYDGMNGAGWFRVPLPTAQTLYWKTQSADASAYIMTITGFEF
jgi:hypothetical protein